MITDDIDAFIASVEKRPALYTKEVKEYSDPVLKKNLWEEVCSEVVPGWDGLRLKDRFTLGEEVRKKWNNLRTCFTRELKAQSNPKTGIAARKRRKYIFFDKLQFLMPAVQDRCKKSNVDIAVDEATSDFTYLGNYENVSLPPPTPKPTATQNFLSETTNEDYDEDTHFVLSLVPSLKALTEDDKFVAKIEMLKILRGLRSKSSASRHQIHSRSDYSDPQPECVTIYEGSITE